MISSGSSIRKLGRKSFIAALTVTLAVGLAPSLPAFAQEGAEAQLVAAPWDGTVESELPTWAQDTGEEEGALVETQANETTSQKTFDLRDRKPSVVNPVRTQNPYSSCWSFGGIAAAETSIMSDFGVQNLDLSEKHLLWFAMHPITKYEDPAQAGEGVHVFGEDKNINAAYTVANPILVSTLFSSGVGPVHESMFPYQGKAGKVDKLGSTYSYSESDDWTVSTLDGNGEPNRTIFSGYTLSDGNILPDFTKTSGNKTVPDKEGMLAVKQELARGHGVVCAFHADASKPGDSGAKFINTETWAHYTYDGNATPNHSVCIVGWDDNYSKSNFNQGTDPKTKASRAPAGDGAWIVRNSWGCKDGCGTSPGGQVIGQEDWGVDGSGYFYISYYDKSLTNGETFTFSMDLNNKEFYAHQHDYMPASDSFLTLKSQNEKDLIASANVFTAEANEEIVSVSTRTNAPNARVTFSVYRLNKNAKSPDDGYLVAKQSCDFEYAGFHRITLNNPFYIYKGEKFSVVSSVAVKNDKGASIYQVTANTAYGQEKASKNGNSYYCEAKVNKGESYLYTAGNWADWSILQSQSTFSNWLKDAGKTGDVVDNFSIKAYGISWDGKLTGGIEGKTYKVSGNKYKVTSNVKSTVTFTAAKNAKKVSVPSKVKINDKTYKVTAIASKAFASAKKKLATASIGKNVTAIGKNAFAGCTKLRTVAGGTSVKSVGAKAFSSCKVLTTCKPLSSKSLATIGSSAFKGCKKLASFTVASKKLTKKGVKKSLVGSSVKTVKVNVGKTKTDKTYAKKYAKYFTKKNCGKKVAVKA